MAAPQQSTNPRVPHDDERAEILRGLHYFFDPGDLFEIRIIGMDGKSKRIDAGYFDDFELATEWILRYRKRATGIYILPNKPDPALKARSYNRIKTWAKDTTADKHILRRRTLGIDIDYERPAGISTTDEEHTAALDLAHTIADYLHSKGVASLAIADSGNGAHVLLRIDLPNNPETTTLIEQGLQSLDRRFAGAGLKIDTSVGNAARIWKAYGSWACKGDDIPERPHRLARLIDVPETNEITPIDVLQALADDLLSIATRNWLSLRNRAT